MWVSHMGDRYTIVLMLQLLCMLLELTMNVQAMHVQAKDVCQVGQEKNQKGQWRWAMSHENPCECDKIISGGKNTVIPKRSFKPVYVAEPMVADNVGEIRDHYGLNCIELKCPTNRSGNARQGRSRRRMPLKIVTAVDNHREPLNVDCKPPLGSNFSIGQTNVTCYTEDRRGNYKSCAFEVNVLDYDECRTNSHNCSTDASCINTDGSYNCSCNRGYESGGFECVDVDECMTASHTCSANALCTNTDGSYTCYCNQGYEGDGFECLDNDECEIPSHNCSANALCTNTDGSYNCSCTKGYEGDGFDCLDIDECQNGDNNCDDHAKCVNADGSFTCVCDTGYSWDGISCDDIDECQNGDNNCDDHAQCVNADGSFTCACDIGYTGDGISCDDISCNQGYEGDGFECSCIALDPPWKLVFKAVAGFNSPVDPYTVWNDNQPINEDVSGANQLNTNFQGYYKSSYALSWGHGCIKEVKLTFLDSSGTEVMTMVFDGKGSTRDNWFTKERLISSPYDDIREETHNYFSAAGHESLNRRWFINRSYNECPNDAGWVVVVGRDDGCSWESSRPSKPIFLYSTRKTYANWNSVEDVAEADLFAIFVRTDK